MDDRTTNIDPVMYSMEVGSRRTTFCFFYESDQQGMPFEKIKHGNAQNPQFFTGKSYRWGFPVAMFDTTRLTHARTHTHQPNANKQFSDHGSQEMCFSLTTIVFFAHAMRSQTIRHAFTGNWRFFQHLLGPQVQSWVYRITRLGSRLTLWFFNSSPWKIHPFLIGKPSINGVFPWLC